MVDSLGSTPLKVRGALPMKDIVMKNEVKNPCSLVLVRNNRRLAGTAAQLVHISECGGWDAFLQGVADQVIVNFAQSYNKTAQRPRLQAVGGMTPKIGANND
jgi:hypothetical protein